MFEPILIERVKLTNYRQYGTCTLEFKHNDENHLTVFVAPNGTGKTTLMNAVTWCLYGEELHSSMRDKMSPIINRNTYKKTQNNEVLPVKVVIEISDGDNHLAFCRESRFRITGVDNGKRIHENVYNGFSVTVTPSKGDANTTTLYDDEAELKVREFFDKKISQYYFFDGERLKDYFVSNKQEIQISIYDLSQVNLLKNVISRLDDICKGYSKEISANNPDLEEYQKRVDIAEAEVKDYKEKLQKEQTRLADIETGMEEIRKKQQSYESIKLLLEKDRDISDQLSRCEERKKELDQRQVKLITQYYPILRLYKHLRDTYDLILEKEKEKQLPPSIERNIVEDILTHGKCVMCNREIDDHVRTYLHDLLTKISLSQESSKFLIAIKGTLEEFFHKASGYMSERNSLQREQEENRQEYSSIESQREKISQSLINMDKDQEGRIISELENKYKKRYAESKEAVANCSQLKLLLKNKQDDFDKYSRELERLIKSSSTDETIKAKRELGLKVETVLRGVEDKIVKTMRKEIETRTQAIFDSMVWKKHTFGKITISDTYETDVYDQDKNQMTGVLSGAEQMALAYAFTFAIHEVSGKNSPLLIDSPLGRVDGENRRLMARALLEISKKKQIIMLMTPIEYSKEVREQFNDNVYVRTLSLHEDEANIEGVN